MTHHDLDLGETTTFPHIVYSVPLHGTHIQMAFFVLGLPRRGPETVSVWTPGALQDHNSLLKPLIEMRSKANL